MCGCGWRGLADVNTAVPSLAVLWRCSTHLDQYRPVLVVGSRSEGDHTRWELFQRFKERTPTRYAIHVGILVQEGRQAGPDLDMWMPLELRRSTLL